MPKLLVAEHVTKRFGELVAVDDVSLELRPNEVVAIVGENGAGKTTLMSMLFGLLEPDEGTVRAGPDDGTVIDSPRRAVELGVGMVHQHFKLVPSLTVAQNIWLGDEPTYRGLLDENAAIEATDHLASRVGLTVDPRAIVADLPVGVRQRIEILKAIRSDADVLILDEPTAVLTPPEVSELLRVVERLASEGRSIVLITHKLDEVMSAATRIVVMRAGQVVAERIPAETSPAEVAQLMVGREIETLPGLDTRPPPRSTALKVRDLCVPALDRRRAVDQVSLEVCAGEIFGIAGVSGNGQAELVDAIAGLVAPDSGVIELDGDDIIGRSPGERRRKGLAHVPEDRLEVGLDMEGTLDDNVSALSYRTSAFVTRGLLQQASFKRLAEQSIERFSIRGASPGRGIDHLSGGNLQKVVLARELDSDPRLLIANQPTRGLDVGSIEFVHRSLLEARDRGVAVLLVSSELDELLALSDRIAVMYRGAIVGPVHRCATNRDALGIMMATGAVVDATERNST